MPNFEFAYNLNGGNQPPIAKDFPIAATQTVVDGDLVVLSGGKMAKASASVAAPFAVIAEASDGAAAGTMVRAYPLMPGQVWRAIADADASSIVLGAKTVDINSDQTVDVGDTSAGAIMVVEADADAPTRVKVVFTKTAWTEIGS